jgi:acyl-CoA synthetase (AMP-forming)/AMP-acid ligase II
VSGEVQLVDSPAMNALTSPRTFWELVAARAALTPDAPVLVDERDRALTFGEYRDAAERVAAGLVALGVGSGSRVSWQLPTALEAVVLMGALARVGAVQNPIIPVLREREVEFITRQASTTLLVVPGTWRRFDHAAMAHDVAARTATEVLVVDPDALADAAVAAGALALPAGDPATLPPPPEPEPAEPAPVRWLYYTSGTTADPKGARHTDRSVMSGANGLIAQLQTGPDDTYPVAFPFTHIGGMSVFTMALTTGCRLPLYEAFDATRSPARMATQGATFLGSAEPFLHAYMAAQVLAGPEPMFPRLRACLSGGAPKTPTLQADVRRTLGGVGVVSSWGLTECPIATHCALDAGDAILATTEGTPVPGVELRLVDARGADVPVGDEGEILVRGPQLFQGYVDASLDAAAFTDDGFFRTGDLGTMDAASNLRITGRLKDVIIRNAENISALEVEGVLAAHPSVAEVAVIGLPDARTGERCCAVVVAVSGQAGAAGGPLQLADLSAHCRAAGLATQKIPEQLELVDEIPRNTMGKVLKQVLRQRFTVPG